MMLWGRLPHEPRPASGLPIATEGRGFYALHTCQASDCFIAAAGLQQAEFRPM
jgi:hypothetical protein